MDLAGPRPPKSSSPRGRVNPAHGLFPLVVAGVGFNVDQAPKLQQRLGVQAIPTLMVLRNGQVIARQAGAAPAPALRAWLEQALQR
jgi:thioredoxin-like negative regulator of GroEL